MNQKDRNRLKERAKDVEALMDQLRELQQGHSDQAGEERDKADNMLDTNMADSERAERLDEAATELEDLESEFDFALDQLQELADRLTDTAENF